MKKRFAQLATSIGIALSQSSNADATIENEYVPIETNLQLFKPLNSQTPIYLAAHRSHKSHASHGSHRSSATKVYSSGGSSLNSNPLGGSKPKPASSYPPSQKCPDSLLSTRKSVVRQVQYNLIVSGDLEMTDIIESLGVLDSDTRSAVRSFQKRKGISSVSGTVLNNQTLNAMGISCN